MMHGEGKLVTSSSEVFEGQFVNDKATGLGKFTNILGDIYEGYLLDGILQGHGKQMFHNGELY